MREGLPGRPHHTPGPHRPGMSILLVLALTLYGLTCLEYLRHVSQDFRSAFAHISSVTKQIFIVTERIEVTQFTS
ncbi:hypothetical protein LX32DRAFT_128481 [Colletotrichum zoysiae]|uniref:Uncharacterized protein n=1 Tax=Colletotrichum zoysiae TaxID=1216348 RepID=A0AAD9M4J4_9PEZI|nr:hypothetical protein LX32DRAFT_128481 [Colletotrichum zoysiae]